MMPVRVLLADDHELVRHGVRGILQRDGHTVVAEAGDGVTAARLARSVRFDVAVLDISMPRMNGIDCAREILATVPGSLVIVLTMFTEDHHIATALHAGVRGYVTKSQTAGELTRAIKDVMAGGTYFGSDVCRVLLSKYLTGTPGGEDTLNSRERQVLQLIAEGNTTKQVAELLGLTPKTAESYRSRLMMKLDIHETAGLVRYAIRQGLVALTALWPLQECLAYSWLM